MSPFRLALSLAGLATLALLLPSAGCGGDGVGGGPVPIDGGASSTSSSSSGSDGGDGGAQPKPKRTVTQRNPFGNVAARNNLLWDGDFEWRSSFADQYGWMSGKSGGYVSYALPILELGWRCKSGLKCARLGPNHRLLGLAVSSQDRDLAISFWANPGGGDCSSVSAVFFTTADDEDAVEVPSQSASPDADGWCRYARVVSQRKTAARLYIENAGSADAVVDDAVIEPLAAEQSRASLGFAPAKTVAVPAWLRQWAREAERPRVTPPNEAERRFRAGLKGRRWTE
jgi:hypothetical protein